MNENYFHNEKGRHPNYTKEEVNIMCYVIYHITTFNYVFFNVTTGWVHIMFLSDSHKDYENHNQQQFLSKWEW